VKVANRDERDCAACDVIKKSNTQGGGSFAVEMTGARFQRQCGMQLNASKPGDDDSPVRPAKHGCNLLGAVPWRPWSIRVCPQPRLLCGLEVAVSY
jgi:hypothetical protein